MEFDRAEELARLQKLNDQARAAHARLVHFNRSQGQLRRHRSNARGNWRKRSAGTSAETS